MCGRTGTESVRYKPWPWTCLRCRTKTVRPVETLYSVEQDLPTGGFMTIQIDDLEVFRCEECGWTVLTDEANKRIDYEILKESLRRQEGA